MFRDRSRIPIEERDYSKYYLVFSGLLFLGTMWAVVDEVSTRRPWKDHQREYRELMEQRYQEQLDFAIMYLDSVSLLELRDEFAAAEDSMRSDAYLSTREHMTAIREQLIDASREYQFAKSRGDEAYYFYRKSLKEGMEDLSEKGRLDENEAMMATYQVILDDLTMQRDSVQEVLDGYRARVRTTEIAISEVMEEVTKWETKLSGLDESVIEIRQVMMLDYDRNPFNDPKARVDRCQTCHLGWNEELAEDLPQPYTLHPVPELLALHNPEEYGCTPCHRGQGNALTAGFAHGTDDHYWENPLLSKDEVWAACNECHENQSSLQFAAQFNKAKRLVIESGCHGCHEIKGYTDLPKIGPSLSGIGSKASPEWIYRWIKEPRAYNPHTRMPNFLFDDEQAEAITAFLMNVSEQTGFSPVPFPGGGNAERGRTVVETVGCMACHVVGDEPRVREARATSYDIAPELTRVGRKVDPSWLYDWVKNPRHYSATTKMPSLRLSEQEARDVVEYLLGLTDNGEGTFDLDLTSRRTIEKGRKLVREFGCAGCHLIRGLEDENRVSVSLSNFGRKKVDEMDFGDTKVEHTWDGWITNKIRNSRMFATDRIIQKMPVFSFSEEEIALIRMFLRSQTKDSPDPRYTQRFDRRQQDIEAGRRIAYHYNCQQCHLLEEQGAYIGAILDDVAFLPPPISGEGKKVQEQWLHSFLQSPSGTGQPNSIRPWIKTRMPTFGFTDGEINQVSRYFLGLSGLEFELRDYRSFEPDRELVRVGKTIFEDFQCAKCHPTGSVPLKEGELSTQDLAPDLTLAPSRLKPDWIIEWLADPGKIQQGTRMPTFFPDGQSPLPDVLDGDAHQQMVAIRDYLMTIGRPASPIAGIP